MLYARTKIAVPVLLAVLVISSIIVCQQIVCAAGYYSIAGYVKLDYIDQSGSKENILSGFSILPNESEIGYSTNANGYFEMKMRSTISVCNFWIMKPGYLTRMITNVPVCGNIVLSPFEMLAGDFNGDRAINMSDITELAKYFNTIPSSTDKTTRYDLNLDGAINMLDVFITAKNFNKTASDYPVTFTYTALPGPTSN